MVFLDAIDVGLRLGGQRVLDGVTLDLAPRESVAVMGPSGAGKSSLLYALAALRAPTTGQVLVDGVDLYGLDDEARARWRLEHAGFVFQRSDLLFELTLAENVALPLEMTGIRRARARRRVEELLERLGLTDCAHRRPAQVSGGQRQRAAVGRALATRPEVVFADEPTGALDSTNGGLVLDLLVEQCSEVGAMLIMVTHDASLAARCQRTVVLRDGQVLADAGTLTTERAGR